MKERVTTVDAAREALLVEADFRADMAPMLDAFEAAIRAEYEDRIGDYETLREYLTADAYKRGRAESEHPDYEYAQGYARGRAESAETLAALREAAMAVNDAFGAMFVDGAYQATQKRIDALNRLQDALAATPAEDDGRPPLDPAVRAHDDAYMAGLIRGREIEREARATPAEERP